MKASLVCAGPFVLATVLTSTVGGDPAPQPPLSFTRGLQGTFNADWQGVAGRTYFTQFSLDLETWHYAPFIDFGDGEHNRGCETDADKFFLRLHYGDFPEITNLDEAMEADLDNDGLSNVFEVTYGYNPFKTNSFFGDPDSSLDPDEDGLSNSTERSAGSDPMTKDHSILMLEIVVD